MRKGVYRSQMLILVLLIVPSVKQACPTSSQHGEQKKMSLQQDVFLGTGQ